MSGLEALRIALDLMHVPTRVRHVRAAPLPEGVPFLLRIAAGDPEAECEALRLVDRPAADIRDAAAFFVEQILFAPGADSYRILGASPDASAVELRRNMALLMRWLHPDSDANENRSVFVGRVTDAWDNVKTAERRAAYDGRVSVSGASRKASKPWSFSSGKRRQATGQELMPSRAKRGLMMRYHRRTGLLGRVLSLLARKRRR